MLEIIANEHKQSTMLLVSSIIHAIYSLLNLFIHHFSTNSLSIVSHQNKNIASILPLLTLITLAASNFYPAPAHLLMGRGWRLLSDGKSKVREVNIRNKESMLERLRFSEVYKNSRKLYF